MKTLIAYLYIFVEKTVSLFLRSAAQGYLQVKGVDFGKGLIADAPPIVKKKENTRIRMGDCVAIISRSKNTDLCLSHPVNLRTLCNGAIIEIGDNTGLSGTSICAALSVKLGNEILLGSNVVITDTDFHPIAPQNRRYEKDISKLENKPVTIEDNVFIGANSIVLKGVTIGKNSVIGAGSIVTKSVPENSIAAGNPCKVLRKHKLHET